jgi:hypothetical protein
VSWKAARLPQAGAGAAIVILATLACFSEILFHGGQFGFRDAGHHYYALHQTVQREWNAGRIPLWNPWENGGVPLLGNPTAAVLYPGKIVFTTLPFAWANRIYVVAHVLLAALSMFLLARHWRATTSGAWLAGIAYGFGGPVLLLHSNVIYLVGAAWLPLALRCGVAWVERPRASNLLGLAAALALMTLGGDPQMAYLALLVCVGRGCFSLRPGDGGSRAAPPLRLGWLLLILAAITLCVGGAILAPACRAALADAPLMPTLAKLCMLVCVLFAMAFWARSGRRMSRQAEPRAILVPGLLGAAGLAFLLAAVQILPTLEFARASSRGARGITFDRYGFSLVPYRVVELFCPGILGVDFPQNATWCSVLPPEGDRTSWVASLYVGGPTLVLALGAILSRPSSRRLALGLMALAALLLSFGLYAGPLGIERWLPLARGWLPHPEESLGTTVETDFRAGDGSPYWLLATLLPGFDLFRYPSKLLPWLALALAALAARGWDEALSGSSRVYVGLALGFAMASLALLAASFVAEPRLLELASRAGRASPLSGPFQPRRALDFTRDGLLQAFGVYLAVGAFAYRGHRLPRLGATAILALLAADLVAAHRPLVWSVPQSVFDEPSRVVAAIREAESRDPSDGPFRIHRPTFWHPLAWFRESSPARGREVVAWERDTLQPLYALPEMLPYTLTLGILESQSYLRLFHPWRLPIGPALGQTVRLDADTPVLHFPRRAFDLWGTQYFVLPVDPGTWRDENRGYASFLDNIDMLAPNLQALKNAGKMDDWREREDWQVFRNRGAFPRAWVVHEARPIPRLESLPSGQQAERIRAFLYSGDALWNEPQREALDLRQVAWVETRAPDRRLELEPPPPDAIESVKVTRHEPQQVDIEVDLAARGLVVLADGDAPGWQLEIDGRPEQIWRTNLGMRGAVVGKGRHRLTYRYVPRPFQVGAVLSALGIVILVALAARQIVLGRKHSSPHRVRLEGESLQ